MKKRAVIIVLILAIAMAQLSTAAAYNRTKAVNYANTYATQHNSDYRYFGLGGNCTNFVSQCLFAGEAPKDSIWWYQKNIGPRILDTYSNAWTVADDFKNYIKNNLQALRLVSKWRKTANPSNNTFAYVNNSNNLTCTGIEIIFYDWDDDGEINHSSIIVKTGTAADSSGDYGDLIDQNSRDRYQVIWHLDDYNTKRDTTAIYAFRLT